MKRLFTISLFGLLAGWAFVSGAQGVASQALSPQAQQPHATIQRAIEDYARVQTNGLPGKATISAGAVDPRLALPACAAMEVFTPPGSRLWGNSSVGVRCGAPSPWTIYVGVTVRVTGSYVSAAQPIAGGQVVSQGDLMLMQGELTQMPAGVVTDMAQAVGKTVAAPVAAGQALRADLLRTPNAILQGQNVKVVSSGTGFRVSADGKAITNAGVGQVAQVRMNSGQTLSGIAQADGSIEIKF
jgi:flagella basal body P-ring formation protein FlgA